MGDLVIDDPVTAVSLFGVIIAVIVGLFSIWSMVRKYSREQRADFKSSNAELEHRLKEFFNLRIETLEARLEANNKTIDKLQEQVDRYKALSSHDRTG